MGVSEVTAAIADAISRQRTPLSSREAYLVFILRGMPLFRDIRRLDLFDRAYQDVLPDEGLTDTERLIDATFWLGADCFYGAYDPVGTRNYYQNTLAPLLEKEGIVVPKSPDLSAW